MVAASWVEELLRWNFKPENFKPDSGKDQQGKGMSYIKTELIRSLINERYDLFYLLSIAKYEFIIIQQSACAPRFSCPGHFF